jgi:hypothetical protein
MAANSVKIGVACPLPGERAAFLEWLSGTDYEPVPMLNLETVAKDLSARTIDARNSEARPIEALIADVSLVSAADLPRVVKMLGPNRPLVLVGAPKDRIEEVPRDATWISRPVTRDNFLLSIALALAEGRPARRSPRQVVPRLLATVDGVASKIVDVSDEGVRLEVTGQSTAALPPYFILKVPSFGVAAKVKRVWVTPGPSHVWCGGIVERPAEKAGKMPWQAFVKTAPFASQKLSTGGLVMLKQID